MKRAKFFFHPCLLFFLSCGIESYPYLEPIPRNNVSRELNGVTVNIPPNNPGPDYFRSWNVFYKIYLSGDIEWQPSPEKNDFRSINETLYNDFLRIEPYTDPNGNAFSSSIVSDFAKWGFYTIDEVISPGGEKIRLRDILDSTALGKTVKIFFSRIPGEIPVINIDGISYRIERSNSIPIPSGSSSFFVNDFLDAGGTINTYNIDVADKPGRNANHSYSYVCFYIVAAGINYETISPVYSIPTFLHVMCLPD